MSLPACACYLFRCTASEDSERSMQHGGEHMGMHRYRGNCLILDSKGSQSNHKRTHQRVGQSPEAPSSSEQTACGAVPAAVLKTLASFLPLHPHVHKSTTAEQPAARRENTPTRDGNRTPRKLSKNKFSSPAQGSMQGNQQEPRKRAVSNKKSLRQNATSIFVLRSHNQERNLHG